MHSLHSPQYHMPSLLSVCKTCLLCMPVQSNLNARMSAIFTLFPHLLCLHLVSGRMNFPVDIFQHPWSPVQSPLKCSEKHFECSLIYLFLLNLLQNSVISIILVYMNFPPGNTCRLSQKVFFMVKYLNERLSVFHFCVTWLASHVHVEVFVNDMTINGLPRLIYGIPSLLVVWSSPVHLFESRLHSVLKARKAFNWPFQVHVGLDMSFVLEVCKIDILQIVKKFLSTFLPWGWVNIYSKAHLPSPWMLWVPSRARVIVGLEHHAWWICALYKYPILLLLLYCLRSLWGYYHRELQRI